MAKSPVLNALVLVTAYFIIAFLVYLPGFSGPMMYDTEGHIEMAQGAMTRGGLNAAVRICPQRPLAMATIYSNFLFDGVHPEYYRMLNVFLLACTAAVVYLLLLLILSFPGIWPGVETRTKKRICLLLGLLFLLHPLQVYSTLYIWQRFVLLACLFSYSSIAVYIAVRSGNMPTIPGYLLCLGLFICGLASKENTIIVPFALILLEITFFSSSMRNLILRAGAYCFAILISVVLMSWWKSFFLVPENAGVLHAVRSNYEAAGFTISEVILTQCRVFFKYIYATLIPLSSNIHLVQPQIMSQSLLQPFTTVVAVVGVIGLVIIAVLIKSRRPLLFFGIAFYGMTMLPEAILLPNYAYCGYRAILPLFGLLVIAGELACYLMRSNYKRVVSGILLTGCLAASLLFGVVTREKVLLWGNPILFWEDAVKSFPEGEGKIEKKVVAESLSNLGHSHIRYGFVPDSLMPLEQAVKVDPGNTIARYNLASAYSEVGRLKEAEKQLRVAALLAPGNPLITNLLSNINKKVQAR